jgi:hypothetical protein
LQATVSKHAEMCLLIWMFREDDLDSIERVGGTSMNLL